MKQSNSFPNVHPPSINPAQLFQWFQQNEQFSNTNTPDLQNSDSVFKEPLPPPPKEFLVPFDTNSSNNSKKTWKENNNFNGNNNNGNYYRNSYGRKSPHYRTYEDNSQKPYRKKDRNVSPNQTFSPALKDQTTFGF